MSEIVFYSNPMSRGRIIRWMLEEVGQPYETNIINYGTEMKSPEFLKINPLGKVPALSHKGKTITECAAICAYLADAFPEKGLAPALTDRADYYRWLFFAAGPLEACIIGRALGFEVPEDRYKQAGYGKYDEMIDTLELAISGKDYIAGNTFSAADVYVGSHIGWGLEFGTIQPREAFSSYVERLHERHAYKRAQTLDNELMPKPPA